LALVAPIVAALGHEVVRLQSRRTPSGVLRNASIAQSATATQQTGITETTEIDTKTTEG